MQVDAFRPKGWSISEQERFWEALEQFPEGPWTSIAAYVGTKDTRQAMTFSQKVRQKLNRWHKKRSWARKSKLSVDIQHESTEAAPSLGSPSGVEITPLYAIPTIDDILLVAPIPFSQTKQPRFESLTQAEADFLLEACSESDCTTGAVFV